MAPWIPRELRIPPQLDSGCRLGPVVKKHALLINPFYPKDPHASFGKHVLTPTLALTSIAGSTPPDWTVQYWDENLLQGPPPSRPFPQGCRHHCAPDIRQKGLYFGSLVS